MSVERRVTLALIFAILVQSCGALLWAGAAAERLEALEMASLEARPVFERLVRVETKLEVIEAQLIRIEHKLEGHE